MRLSQAARNFNVSTDTIVSYLAKKNLSIDPTPNTKLSPQQLTHLTQEFSLSAKEKDTSLKLKIQPKKAPVHTTTPTIPPQPIKPVQPPVVPTKTNPQTIFKVVGKISLSPKRSTVQSPTQPPTKHTTPPPILTPTKTPTAPHAQASQPTPPTPQAQATQPTPPPKSPFKILGSLTLPPQQRKKKYFQVVSSDKTNLSQLKPSSLASPNDQQKNPQTPPKHYPTSNKPFRPSTHAKTRQTKYKKEKKQQILKKHQTQQRQVAQQAKTLHITEYITIKELANLMKVPSPQLLATCMDLGIIATINQTINPEAIILIAEEYNYQVSFITVEPNQEQTTKAPKQPHTRAPIISVMGHVDHGKTTLLDHIRKTNLAKKEAGGITQQIGAYQASTPDNQPITFLDTPGHQIFTAMRARGAQITDLALIVIAADDGIMPQTKEAISHAQLASIPMLFAINKIDKPQANLHKIEAQLAELNIIVENLGGTVKTQPISAKTGQGIQELLTTICKEAQALNLQADLQAPAKGTVIEASLERGKGYQTNLIVQDGILKIGQAIASGQFFGKIKAMIDHQGAKITVAPPATPVQILGLNGAPSAGETFKVMSSEKEARQYATRYKQIHHQQTLRASTKQTQEDLIHAHQKEQTTQSIPLIIKTHTTGAAQALEHALLLRSNQQVKINIINPTQKRVGAITESDINDAKKQNATIIGFDTHITSQLKKLATNQQVPIKLYQLIHQVTDHIDQSIAHLTKPAVEATIASQATIIQVFKIGNQLIAGCQVTQGTIKSTHHIRLIRHQQTYYQGAIKAIEIERKNVKQATEGTQCAISTSCKEIQVGDHLQAIQTTTP